MKIWNAYASEHSANLVMIGRFKTVRDAEEAKRLIARLTEQVSAESASYGYDAPPDRRFSDAMLKLLTASQLHSLYPTELGQFEYDVSIEVKDSSVVLTTDEVDVSAFLKVLIDKGARVEVFSAHDYPDVEVER